MSLDPNEPPQSSASPTDQGRHIPIAYVALTILNSSVTWPIIVGNIEISKDS